MRRLAVLECSRVLRSRALVGAVAAWLVAAAAALVNGDHVIERQRQALAASDALQREQHDAVLATQPPGAVAGDQLYYLAFHTRHEPSPWAAVSLGQRDVRPFNVKVRILALHGQLYDAELTSPLLAALGTFDLAFVIVVLGPLLAIALGHDLVSSERELGTWPLVRAQPDGERRALTAKIAVRAVVLLMPLLLTTSILPVAMGVAMDGRLVGFAVAAALYLALWLAITVVVATCRLASDANALVLLAGWVMWVVVGPALVTTAASARFPAPEALALAVAQREGYHASWDRPVAETMAAFYTRYPEWRGHPVPADRYSNAWYYAMQQRGDDAAAPSATAYLAALQARHAWVQRWLWLFPPARLQSAVDRMARTDLPAHLDYLASVAAFHERLKRHFFPVIFSEAAIADVAWSRAPRHQFADEGRGVELLTAMSGLLGWTLAAAGIAVMRRNSLS